MIIKHTDEYPFILYFAWPIYSYVMIDFFTFKVRKGIGALLGNIEAQHSAV